MSAARDKKHYFEAVGRRKTSAARVRIAPAAKPSIMVNDRELGAYFPTRELVHIVDEPFRVVKPEEKLAITVHVKGGGIHSQAEAVSHGIARALLVMSGESKDALRKGDLLTRDDRAKERRKFGLKKARKSPQWSKR